MSKAGSEAQLIQTKFFHPLIRPEIVNRVHLVQRLNQGLSGKLIIISAPAGFGKTTLLSEWANQLDYSIAWLTLEENDNDLIQFFKYLIAAIKQVFPEIGEDILAAIDRPVQPPINNIITRLINEIMEDGSEFIMVIDDYHLIDNVEVHEALSFLLTHIPLNFHLVITGRYDPPLPLSKLRSQGILTELRSADLRFSIKETRVLLNEMMKLDLSSKEINALEKRTEGWVASLQLAAQSLQGRADKEGFVTDFSGSNRHIMDYLVDEVLSQQTEEMQDFLFRTSILNRFSTQLCNHILESSNSQKFIKKLEEKNLFLISMDDNRHWYRYHALFIEFLRQRLKEKEPDNITKLHRRAAEWYWQNNYFNEAVFQAVKAEDFQLAADIIDSVIMRLLLESKLANILDLSDKLPDRILYTRPQICVVRAWASILSGKMEAIEELLDSAESILAGQESEENTKIFEILGLITTCRAFYAFALNDFEKAIDLSNNGLKSVSKEDSLSQSILYLTLGLSYLNRGQFDQAVPNLEEAYRFAKMSKNYYVYLVAYNFVGQVVSFQGKLKKAAKMFEKAIELGNKWGHGWPLPATGYPYIGLGKILFEWNEIDRAEINIIKGIELGEEAKESNIIFYGSSNILKLKKAKDDKKGMLEAFERVRKFCQQVHESLCDRQYRDTHAWIWLQTGQDGKAKSWAVEKSKISDRPLNHLQMFENITMIKILLHNKEYKKSMEILERYRKNAEKYDLDGFKIEILLHEALAYQLQDEIDKALIKLENAFKLAEPEGYIRTFIDEGEQLNALLREAQSRNIFPDYVKKLLKEFKMDKQRLKTGKEVKASQILVDELSERELEVLHLIAEGLKYKEIADKIFVSLNTVRSHTKSIYSKLNVNSRLEAIEKAKELNLL